MPYFKQLKENVKNYLGKFFLLDELSARVKNVLAIKRTRDILQEGTEEKSASIEELAKKISEQKRTLECAWGDVCVANRVRDEFLMSVVHELRTPLTLILGYLDLLRQIDKNSQDFAEYLEIIQRNANRQAKLINDLLDITRMISGRLKIDKKPLSLSVVIDKAITATRLLARAKDIQIKINLSSNLCQIRGDEECLVQILWNILANAVEYTPRAGTINMEVHQDNQRMLISITDSGPGFETDFLPYAFEWFKQAPNSVSKECRRYGEFGVGLAIVRYLVELHGGSVRAENKKIGASVTISLPVMAELYK